MGINKSWNNGNKVDNNDFKCECCSYDNSAISNVMNNIISPKIKLTDVQEYELIEYIILIHDQIVNLTDIKKIKNSLTKIKEVFEEYKKKYTWVWQFAVLYCFNSTIKNFKERLIELEKNKNTSGSIWSKISSILKQK